MGLFTRLASMQPRPLQQFLAILFAVLIGGVCMAPAALAIAPTDLPDQRPVSHVVDDAEVLSRASRKELENRLEAFGGNKLDARLVTLRRLDYGLSLGTFGTQLIERWSSSGDINSPLLLFLIERSRVCTFWWSWPLRGKRRCAVLSSCRAAWSSPAK